MLRKNLGNKIMFVNDGGSEGSPPETSASLISFII